MKSIIIIIIITIIIIIIPILRYLPIQQHLDLDCEIVIREAFEELAASLEIFEQERGNWEQERGNFEQERGEKEDMAR